jgi:hypothetical protein
MPTRLRREELWKFNEYYEKYWKRLPVIKTRALYAGGKVLQAAVRSAISEDINDRFGRVKSWQLVYLGSKGGYAAVRPVAEYTGRKWNKKEVFSNKITTWLYRGHGVRRSENPDYEPRYKKAGFSSAGTGYVSGHYFYSWGRTLGERKAYDAMAREIERLVDDWDF